MLSSYGHIERVQVGGTRVLTYTKSVRRKIAESVTFATIDRPST